MCDPNIEEISQLLSELSLMKKEIKHSTIIDSNKILKKYEDYAQNDSGIDSELDNENFILPADNLQEIMFESSDFDEVLKRLFKYVWQCLQKLITDIMQNEKKIELILECIKDFVTFLKDSQYAFFREEIVKKNLEMLFAKAMDNSTEDLFNFVMEIFVKLGAMEDLYGCIFNLILEKIKIFADKIKLENLDDSFIFNHETEFSRTNTLMLTALILKEENQNELSIEFESKYDIRDILETFARHKDFYILEFLSRKLFLSADES